MKFIKTFKSKLADQKYPWQILDNSNLRDLRRFHQDYPAPLTFVIPDNVYTIGDKQLQILALWYLQGTHLLVDAGINKNNERRYINIVCPAPRARWAYTFVNDVPKHYIRAGKTTSTAAYEYGQTLIDAVNKANKIPYSILEYAYKDITRTLLSIFPNMQIYSPNTKTLLEVRAELKARKEINEITCIDNSEEAELLEHLYDEYELNLYCRVFAITMPEWSLRYRMVATKHGYAQCPELVMSTGSSNFANSNYAGTDEDFQNSLNRIPYTLRRDSLPTKIAQHNLTIELAQQITWYLKTYKLTKDNTLLSPDWGYCENCGFYQKSEGCQCGRIPSIEDIELETIRETYEDIQNGTFDINTIEEV